MIPERNPYNNWNGNGSTKTFDFDFLIEDETQLVVYHTNSSGVQTVLTYGTDYSINELGNENGSFITFPLDGSSYETLGSDEVISLCLTLPISQDEKYNKSGFLNRETIEYSLDKLTRICQILSRELSRSLKVLEGSNIDTNQLSQDLMIVADNVLDVNTTAKDIVNINTVAENITDVNTVSGSINSVNTVSASITDVNTVSDNIANIDECAQNINAIIDAPAQAANAASSAAAASGFAGAALSSENAAATSAQNAATSENNAQIWAEGTDSEVQELGGFHSAKGWAEWASGEVNGSNFLNKSQITNCILEAPESIKIEYDSEHLTLKAGSVITVPYGTVDLSSDYPAGSTFIHNNFKVAGTSFVSGKFFVYAAVQSDITISDFNESISDSISLIFVALSSNILNNFKQSQCSSGSTTPASGQVWYNTADNKILAGTFPDSIGTGVFAFPVLEFLRDTGELKSVNSVFNTCGYIGSTVFVNKGIKVLMPDGKNPDGTLKNVEYLTPTVSIQSVEDLTSAQIRIMCTQAGSSRATMPHWEYNPGINYICGTGSDNLFQKYVGTMVGEATVSDGKITSFKPYNTFHAIDYNEAVKRGGDTMSGDLIFEDGANPVIQYSGYPRLVLQNSERLISDGAGQIPSDIAFGQVLFIDKNGATTGYYQNSVSKSQNIHYTNFGLNRTINSVMKQASAGLQIDSSGTRSFYATVDNFTINGTTVRYVTQTYINGTSWYRVWSDGWIEQGGVITLSGLTVLSFLKTFSNTNYNISFAAQSDAGGDIRGVAYTTIAAASITIYGFAGDDNYRNFQTRWRACGYVST